MKTKVYDIEILKRAIDYWEKSLKELDKDAANDPNCTVESLKFMQLHSKAMDTHDLKAALVVFDPKRGVEVESRLISVLYDGD